MIEIRQSVRAGIATLGLLEAAPSAHGLALNKSSNHLHIPAVFPIVFALVCYWIGYNMTKRAMRRKQTQGSHYTQTTDNSTVSVVRHSEQEHDQRREQ